MARSGDLRSAFNFSVFHFNYRAIRANNRASKDEKSNIHFERNNLRNAQFIGIYIFSNPATNYKQINKKGTVF